MQHPAAMGNMMKDLTQYIMMPKIRYAPGIGTYVSYDIAAYDGLKRDFVTIVWDATSDRDLALRMVGQFNRYQLSPIHLKDAIPILNWAMVSHLNSCIVQTSSRMSAGSQLSAWAIRPTVFGLTLLPTIALFTVGRGRLAAAGRSALFMHARAIANSSFLRFTFNGFTTFISIVFAL